ncbi:MAG: xanthine dehydrogenase family protein [Proteobacteria bacterium]|nr:xanthine dehydrogenase family protein [Burkholderiales bacterium]
MRKDALAKIRGEARYVDDYRYPGMWFGATVRTRSPGGTVERVEFGPGIDWSQFVVVTAADIAGKNSTGLIDGDQPVLVERTFRHAAEPVLLLAHPERSTLRAALDAIVIHERANPEPVFDIDEALGLRAELFPGNVYRDYLMARGDLALGAAQADIVFDGRFETGSQEHVYIEPQGMIAQIDAAGVLVIEGSMQCPYYVLDTVTAVTARNAGAVRIVHRTTGGGFGGKEEYPSHIAAHAALLSLKAGGRAVKLIYDRAEDMLATPKRHPSRTRVRLGARHDGRLTFLDIDFALDAGAYATLSPVVLSRGVIHAPGPYACAHARVRGRAVATNHPPNGAFRGFGAPQSIFAIEQAMDGLARAAGMSPLDLRRLNMLRPGDRSVPGQSIDDTTDFDAVLDRALGDSDYIARRAHHTAFNAANAQAGRPVRRGIGLSTFHHGAGFTGNGEVMLASEASVRADRDGRVEVVASSSEMGQGNTTTLCQIVADALVLPLDRVSQAVVDTHDVPNSGPTVASRTCMVVGAIVEQAARRLRAALIEHGGPIAGDDPQAFSAACARYLDAHPKLEAHARYEPPENVQWDEQAFLGSPYASYAWAAHVAEVEVDLDTFEVTLLDFTATQEVGKVINPTIAAGQVQGGVAQAIGFALFEKVMWNANGTMANNRLTNYIIPTSADMPAIRVAFLDQPGGAGAAGAKGLGELPMDGPAPAIVSAINFALDTRIARVPVLPEDIMRALPA